MQGIYYFAYGSNLNPHRLKQRIGHFQVLTTGYLPEHKLVFNKLGGDSSGKCTIQPASKQVVWGAIYELSQSQRAILDEIEGVGHGYQSIAKSITCTTQTFNALLYQAELNALDDGVLPFSWYKNFVLTGAIEHRFPEAYVDSIKTIKSIDDRDKIRAQHNWEISQGRY